MAAREAGSDGYTDLAIETALTGRVHVSGGVTKSRPQRRLLRARVRALFHAHDRADSELANSATSLTAPLPSDVGLVWTPGVDGVSAE